MAAGDLTVGHDLTVENDSTLPKIKGVTDTGVVTNLNADQVDGADKDTDGTLAGNSDTSVPTEKAVKTYVDAQDGTHAALAVVGTHGSTEAAIANKLIHRDGAGRARVAAPLVDADIARKDMPAVGVIETGASAVLRPKVIEIGDWDMDFTKTVQVAHGLTIAKIRSLDVMIRNDPDTSHFPLNYPEQINYTDTQGSFRADAVNIVMSRTANGIFDDVVFDSTDYNRGWITIWYEV